MNKRSTTFIVLILFTFIPTIFIWLPFLLRLESFWNIPLPLQGMATIVANYDGPLYIIAAKSLYIPEIIKSISSFPLPTEYYAAHFPLYPLLIRIFSYAFGYAYATLIVTSLASFVAIVYFHKFIGEFVSKKDAYWFTFVFSIFPARWLIVRSVGSPEPIFIALIIASVYYFRKKNFLKAGMFGALAQLTKSPGILLFFAYFLAILTPSIQMLATNRFAKWVKNIQFADYLGILLIPLALIGVFLFYDKQMGNFFAYFNSGDNIHLLFPPFQIFNYSASWVGTFWLEEVILIYLLGFIGLVRLIKMKEYDLAWLVGVFLSSIIFVSHRDIMRYILPVVPFLYVSYSEFLKSTESKIIIIGLIIPLFLFSLVFISQNTMPISDWAPLL